MRVVPARLRLRLPASVSKPLRQRRLAEVPREAGAFLREAELASERLSAVVRMVIFISLLMLALTTRIDHHHERFALLTILAYGTVALVALALAWKRVFHPILPYAYATFDVILVSLNVLFLTTMLDFPPHMAFAIPASGLIFLVLAHAAMRFRTWLVVYAGAVAIILMAVGMVVIPAPEETAALVSNAEHPDLVQSVLHSRILPFVIIALMTLALWATSRRTYEILQTSIDRSRRLAMLSRFFSPRLADRLARANAPDLRPGSRHRCAIMFIDIRGFTELARKMDPEALRRFLTEFRSVVTDVIFEHGGMVDKFIGDAVLAVFGALEPAPDDAERAILCGLNILDAVGAWSAASSGAGGPSLRTGIGAHYGEVFVGAVGDEKMLEFTVLGDTVNLAERLERTTRVIDGVFVISRDMLDAAGRAGSAYVWTPVSEKSLSGRLQGMKALSLQAGWQRQPSIGSPE
jgi:adenylate cyclase